MERNVSRPRRLEVDVTGAGKWLRLEEILYVDRQGRRRTWEAAARQQQQGAVLMIPVLRPSDRYVLVRQYRPAADRVVLEFPAGLIDAGEPPETTALRELCEETGYTGTITWLGSPAFNSPGMSGECAIVALMDIDETRPENRSPTPDQDDGEDIEVCLVEKGRVPAFLRETAAAGLGVDIKVVSYFLGAGLELGSRLSC